MSEDFEDFDEDDEFANGPPPNSGDGGAAGGPPGSSRPGGGAAYEDYDDLDDDIRPPSDEEEEEDDVGRLIPDGRSQPQPHVADAAGRGGGRFSDEGASATARKPRSGPGGAGGATAPNVFSTGNKAAAAMAGGPFGGGGSLGGPAHVGKSGAVHQGMSLNRVAVNKTVYDVEQALRYRYLMRPVVVPLGAAEKAHLNSLIYRYLVDCGLQRTADVFAQQVPVTPSDRSYSQRCFHAGLHATAVTLAALHGAGTNAMEASSAQSNNALMANRLGAAAIPSQLYQSVSRSAERTGMLFDDDTVWPSEAFFGSPMFELPTIASERGAPLCATVDRLLEKLVLDETEAPLIPGALTMHFTNVFMVTHPCFVSPDVLFTKFAKMFKTVTLHSALLGDTKRNAWHERIVLLLTVWVTIAQIDLTRTLLERVLSFAVSISHAEDLHRPSVTKLAGRLIMTVERLLAMEWSGRAARPFPALAQLNGQGGDSFERASLPNSGAKSVALGGSSNTGPQPNVGSDATVFQVTKSILDASESDVAKQLCLIHHAQFCNVAPREFCHAAWADPDMAEFATGLVTFLQYTEDVTLWIASLIITPVDLPERRRVYSRCVRIAKELFELRNFSMARAVYSGVDHGGVNRLSSTVSLSSLAKEDADALEGLRMAFDPFRDTMRDLPFNLSAPCVPFLGPYLNDACKLHENHKTIVHVAPASLTGSQATSSSNSKQGAGGGSVGTGGTPAAGGTGKDSAALAGGGQGGGPGNQGAASSNAAATAMGGGDNSTSSLSGGVAIAVVNWSKMMQLAKTLLRVVSYQLVRYSFPENAVLQRLLLQLPLKREADALYELSAEREQARR